MAGDGGARVRWPLGAGAVLALLLSAAGGGGPASAAAGSSAAATQPVSTASARVVVQAGTQPASAGAAPMVLASLLGPQFAVVTDLGTAQPSKVLYDVSGLAVLPSVTACSQPWTVPTLGTPSCADGGRALPLGVTTADPALVPSPARTWYLLITGVVSAGTLQVSAWLPVGTTGSS